MADDSKRALPLALPFGALRRLLDSDETRVSSENTVFWVADTWLQQQDVEDTEEERWDLAACLRLHHMSPLYLISVVGQNSWAPARRTDWGRAAAYVVGPEALKKLMREGEDGSALRRPARPASAVSEGVLQWDVPLAQLKELHAKAAALQVGEDDYIIAPSYCYWGGLTWRLTLYADRVDGGVAFGLYVTPGCPPDVSAAATAGASVTATVPGSNVVKQASPQMYSIVDGRNARGWGDFFGLGAQAAWDEAAWRTKDLVGEGGLVRLHVTIGPVM